jgi:hypothetical protein
MTDDSKEHSTQTQDARWYDGRSVKLTAGVAGVIAVTTLGFITVQNSHGWSTVDPSSVAAPPSKTPTATSSSSSSTAAAPAPASTTTTSPTYMLGGWA